MLSKKDIQKIEDEYYLKGVADGAKKKFRETFTSFSPKIEQEYIDRVVNQERLKIEEKRRKEPVTFGFVLVFFIISIMFLCTIPLLGIIMLIISIGLFFEWFSSAANKIIKIIS